MIIQNSKTNYVCNGVIFDMDGLIFDSERLFFQHKRQVCAEYGYEETEETYAVTLGLNGSILKETLLAQKGPDYPAEEISRISRQRMMKTVRNSGIPVKTGIVELLEFLKKKQIPCAIASSTHIDFVKEYLTIAKISDYFTAVIGGNMISKSKPEPDIFLAAAKAIGCMPEECLVLEDSENGILAAHNAKIPVICIPDMKYPADRFKELTFDLKQDATQLLNTIKEINQ